MTQHYPDPNEVLVPADTRPPTKSLKAILERDGQIVPVLVIDGGNGFLAADTWQGERVLAIRELGWPTILVETEWDPDDL